VRVVDVAVASAGFLYIVMELVEGAPLRASARAEHDLGWAIAVLRQVARGLAALHAAGIVHRDLKPANVLIAEATDGGLRVKISDFGISLGSEALAETAEHTRADTPLVIAAGANPTVSVRAAGAAAPALAADARACAPETTAATAAIPNPPVLPAVPALRSFGSPTPPSRPSGPGSPLTRTGFLPGTPAYIAPELVRGRSHISPAADVFAFGVMAFELATGQRPFAEPPVLAMLAGRIPTWPKPLAESDPSLPPGLAELIDRCLSPQPEARPTSEQISAQLAALDGEPRR
jgi:serine/threonine protein kinase